MKKQPKPPRRRRSATEWRSIIHRWEESGERADTFAEKHRLSKRSLTWWRWRLQRGATSRAPTSSRAPLTFVPLVATSSRSSNETAGEARWILETATGVRVEMSGATALVVDGLGVALERVRKGT